MYVQEVSPDEADCDGLSPQTIASRFNLPYVDIFKVDIEGAEMALFTEDPTWLSVCGVVYVDVHSEDAARAVTTAGRQYGFNCHRYRELCILSRPG